VGAAANGKGWAGATIAGVVVVVVGA